MAPSVGGCARQRWWRGVRFLGPQPVLSDERCAEGRHSVARGRPRRRHRAIEATRCGRDGRYASGLARLQPVARVASKSCRAQVRFARAVSASQRTFSPESHLAMRTIVRYGECMAAPTDPSSDEHLRRGQDSPWVYHPPKPMPCARRGHDYAAPRRLSARRNAGLTAMLRRGVRLHLVRPRP